MNSKDHISSLKVENFKKFNLVELNDIGHFNLIVGDNNVGKTSLLESLLVDKKPMRSLAYLTYSMARLIAIRKAHMCVHLKNYYLRYGNNSFSIKFDDDTIDISLVGLKELNKSERQSYQKNLRVTKSTKDIFRYVHSNLVDKPKTHIYSTCLSENIYYEQDVDEGSDHSSGEFPYIPTNYFSPHSAANIYNECIYGSVSKEDQFIKIAKVMIPDIDRIYLKAINKDASNTHIYVRRKGEESAKLLVSYGDGAVRIFQIILDIFLAKGSKLMIDEIDTGIHYSRFKEFWKTIIMAARENEVQLFCTTHNLEAIQFYKEALIELGEELQDEARLFQLKNYEDGSTMAYNYDFEKLSHYLETENELRGGQLQLF